MQFGVLLGSLSSNASPMCYMRLILRLLDGQGRLCMSLSVRLLCLEVSGTVLHENYPNDCFEKQQHIWIDYFVDIRLTDPSLTRTHCDHVRSCWLGNLTKLCKVKIRGMAMISHISISGHPDSQLDTFTFIRHLWKFERIQAFHTNFLEQIYLAKIFFCKIMSTKNVFYKNHCCTSFYLIVSEKYQIVCNKMRSLVHSQTTFCQNIWHTSYF